MDFNNLRKMKNLNVSFVLIASTIVFIACKDKQQEKAQKSLESYKQYIDSVGNVAHEKASPNWETIENKYSNLKMNTQSSLATAKDKAVFQMDFDNSSMKYQDYKNIVITEKEKKHKESLNTSLLGPNYKTDNFMFNWVNKNNILSVYKNFVATAQKNKDSYSRENWDEIKLVYEALDTRKNTVEKEGLSKSDNLKIAALKLKFIPIYTLNRMGAKFEENTESIE